MIFWITVVLTIAAMVIAGVVASRNRWNDSGDVALTIFFTWLIAFIVSCGVLGIAGASHSASATGPTTQTGKWDYKVAANTTPEIDQEDGEFEFYVNQNGVMQEMELHYSRVTYLPGGDRKNITVLDERTELGTAVFPWGQARDVRTITVK